MNNHFETVAKFRLPAELIVGLRFEVIEISVIFLRPLDFARGRKPVERLRSSPHRFRLGILCFAMVSFRNK